MRLRLGKRGRRSEQLNHITMAGLRRTESFARFSFTLLGLIGEISVLERISLQDCKVEWE